MKQMLFSALLLGGALSTSNGAFAEAAPDSVASTKQEPSKWEQIVSKLPKISGYLQTGWNYNTQGDGSSSFQAKRLRINMDGTVSEKVSFNLQLEAFNGVSGATNGNGQKAIQVLDAFATIKLTPGFQIRAGQFYTPQGFENYELSPGSLETVDFTAICDRIVCRNPISYDFEDFGRDLGVMIMGDLLPNEEKGFSYLSYNLALTNGSLHTRDDDNKSKDIIGALTVRPFQYFSIQGSFNWGESAGTLNGETFKHQPIKRGIVGVWYNDPNGFDLRAEYGYMGSSKDGRDIIKENGFYALAGYRTGKLFPLVRYDLYRDKVNEGSLNNYSRILAGLNWYPMKNVRIQANYGHFFYTDKAKEASNGGKSGSDQFQLMGVFYF